MGGSWSQCLQTCGATYRTRTRSCVEPQYGGKPCTTRHNDFGRKDATHIEHDSWGCPFTYCPIDAKVDLWSNWGGCSKSCGSGLQYRSRTCISKAEHNGKSCADVGLTESLSCNTHECLKCEEGSGAKCKVCIEEKSLTKHNECQQCNPGYEKLS